MNPATASSFSRAGIVAVVDLLDRRQQQRPALDEELVQDLVLGVEVVVDEPVGDVRLAGDVGDAAGVEALAGEDADRRVEDLPPPVDRRCLGHQRRTSRRVAASGRPSGRRLASDGSDARISLEPLEVEVGGDEALAVGGLRRAPGPRGRRSSSARRSRSAAAPCRTGSAASTNAWFSIARARSRTSQWSRPVASVNADGHREQAGARARRGSGRAPGSGGRSRRVSPTSTPPTSAADDLVAGLLVLGLAVADPADVDVEHVDLAVGGDQLAVGRRSGTRC